MRAIVKRKSFERKLIQISIWQQCSYAMWYRKKSEIKREERTHSKRADKEENGEKKQHGGKFRKTVPTNNTQTYIVVLVYTIGKTSLSRIIHTKLCVYIFIIYISIYLYMFHFFVVVYYIILFYFYFIPFSFWPCRFGTAIQYTRMWV